MDALGRVVWLPPVPNGTASTERQVVATCRAAADVATAAEAVGCRRVMQRLQAALPPGSRLRGAIEEMERSGPGAAHTIREIEAAMTLIRDGLRLKEAVMIVAAEAGDAAAPQQAAVEWLAPALFTAVTVTQPPEPHVPAPSEEMFAMLLLLDLAQAEPAPTAGSGPVPAASPAAATNPQPALAATSGASSPAAAASRSASASAATSPGAQAEAAGPQPQPQLRDRCRQQSFAAPCAARPARSRSCTTAGSAAPRWCATAAACARPGGGRLTGPPASCALLQQQTLAPTPLTDELFRVRHTGD